ncbi:polysaccharide deacetylase family protein [Clostridium hominis]|uniref:polysaccharide deacetylase family protein n=1 Tax=Clostridium hominis TaxID=2763036 RepID=UPI0028FE1831|nr:polysaccharide deacetylase family protein [Clostridium sp.]
MFVSATHPHLEELNEDNILKEVLGDKINLEKIYGGVIRGMSYPFGTYNSKVKDIIRSCGVDYSRTIVENEDIEEFAEMVSNKNDIWYATNIEVYDYITSIKSLRFPGDKSRVYNPSSLDIWISIDGKTVKIGSRKTIELL